MLAIPPDHRVDASSGGGGLFHILADAARRQSDGVLALGAGAGLVVAAVVMMVDALWAPLALPAAAAAAFGGWGILDRTLAERQASHAAHVGTAADGDAADHPTGADRALGALEALLGIAGWVALGAFLFLAFGRIFDGWIH